MMQTGPDSIIEIWSNYYIKHPNKREKRSKRSDYSIRTRDKRN